MPTTYMFPRLLDEPRKQAVDMPDGRMSYAELAAAAARLAAQLPPRTLALWATPSLATVVGLLAGLRAGAPVIPLNPKSGELELAHVIADGRPSAVLAAAEAQLPGTLEGIPRIPVRPHEAAAAGACARHARSTAEPALDAPALILYTSGTTGMAKGVVHTLRSLAANLDALAAIWGLTSADRLVHALPLFHAHGLVLATIGPLRFGGSVKHVGAFEVEAVAGALADDETTVLYAVPTMYHRLLAAAVSDRRVADALRGARLLVSGSAALAVDVHRGIERLTGRAVVERYGMTETLMISSTRPGEPSRPGYVGRPLPGVSVRVSDEDGVEVPRDDATIGSVWVRSPSLFAGYAGREQTTTPPLRDGWFHTGDLAVVAGDGALRLVGRSSTDLIKSGGYRIAAGEIESVLLAHPAVEQVAVRGVPDAELGERVVAWVVPAGDPAAADGELIDHVAAQLTPHKRPREIRRVASLPRNELGKVQKQRLDGHDVHIP